VVVAAVVRTSLPPRTRPLPRHRRTDTTDILTQVAAAAAAVASRLLSRMILPWRGSHTHTTPRRRRRRRRLWLDMLQAATTVRLTPRAPIPPLRQPLIRRRQHRQRLLLLPLLQRRRATIQARQPRQRRSPLHLPPRMPQTITLPSPPLWLPPRCPRAPLPRTQGHHILELVRARPPPPPPPAQFHQQPMDPTAAQALARARAPRRLRRSMSQWAPTAALGRRRTPYNMSLPLRAARPSTLPPLRRPPLSTRRHRPTLPPPAPWYVDEQCRGVFHLACFF